MPHKDPDVRRAYAREYAEKRRRAAGVEPRSDVPFDPVEWRKRYYERNRERLLAEAKERYHKNGDRNRTLAKARYKPERARANTLKRQYGMTLEDEQRMRLEQNGACAICGEVVNLVVDHDHETGVVRGLLCNACNSALGYFRDDPARMDAARRYLGYHIKRVVVMPESKTGTSVPKSWRAFVSSVWFGDALFQSERAVPFGTSVVPGVVIDGRWLIADLKPKKGQRVA
jgi:hypothetical protein